MADREQFHTSRHEGQPKMPRNSGEDGRTGGERQDNKR
jgi:hypothetical protein